MKKRKLFLVLSVSTMLLSSCGGGDQNQAQEENKFIITFKDENSNTIESKEFKEGTVPSYTYSKDDTDEWDYTFEGWSSALGGDVLSALPEVSGDATYYAIISKVKRKYTITFETNCDTKIAPITADYGSTINEPEKLNQEGYRFISWTKDSEGKEEVTFPYTITKNETLYAKWNEKVDIKGYLKTLIDVTKQDPSSCIPDTLREKNSANYVNKNEIAYNFENHTNVETIRYGGFGEQWHMVVDNIRQSERFYSILSIGELAINSSVILFNNFLDKNPNDTASHTIKESEYTASLDFKNNILSYSLKYKTKLEIPFFGQVSPQIDMVYDINNSEKTVRIHLTENNAIKYSITDNTYKFALEYGVEAVNRKAYFQISELDNHKVEGSIYEFIKYKDKDLIPSCAEFYIDDQYTSVVGNKASGLVGFKGFINELYNTKDGKLIGYKVRETLEILGVKGQYNTLWFNLNNITGINSVKTIKNDNIGNVTNKNPHDIYLNGSSNIFEPAYNKKLAVKTSRKYDVELRKQYFYSLEEDKIEEHETNIPMMFIQDDNDVDTNYSDFTTDMLETSKISASVNLENKYLEKIRADYDTLIDIFIEHKDLISTDEIDTFIGESKAIE